MEKQNKMSKNCEDNITRYNMHANWIPEKEEDDGAQYLKSQNTHKFSELVTLTNP